MGVMVEISWLILVDVMRYNAVNDVVILVGDIEDWLSGMM